MEHTTGNKEQHILRYANTEFDYKSSITNKPKKLSQELGIYGYAGNINPKFIEAIWAPKNLKYIVFEKSDFERLTPKEAKQRLNLI